MAQTLGHYRARGGGPDVSKQKVRADLLRQLHEVLVIPGRAGATIYAGLCVFGYIGGIPADAESVPINTGGGVVRFTQAFPRRKGLGYDGMVGPGDKIGGYDGRPDICSKATHGFAVKRWGGERGREKRGGGRGEVSRKKEVTMRGRSSLGGVWVKFSHRPSKVT